MFIIISFCLGIGSLQCLPFLPSFKVLIIILIVSLIGITIFRNRQKKYWFVILVSFVLGISWSTWQGQNVLSWRLPDALIKKNVELEGVVASIPQRQGLFTRFIVQSSIINNSKSSSLFFLSWFGPPLNLTVGDLWRFQARLKPPHGLHNPGTFDYEQWLFSQQIRATGYITAHPSPEFLKTTHLYSISRWRQIIMEKMLKIAKNDSLSGVLVALTIGSRAALSSDIWQVFQNTGTGHLVAISGLHLGLIVAMIFWLVDRSWRCSARLILYCPSQRAASFGALISATLYAVIAGMSLPTQRALIMIYCLFIPQLLRRDISPWRRLILAIMIMLLFEPTAVLSVSFWLSSTAVFWIFYIFLGRLKNPTNFIKHWKMHILLTIGLLPLSLIAFQRMSAVSIPANLIAIPWIGFVILPLGLIALIFIAAGLSLGSMLLQLDLMLLKPLWIVLQWLNQFPFAVWWHPLTESWSWFLIFAATLLLLAPSGWPGRYFGWLWLIGVLCWQRPPPLIGGLSMTVLDVGQGLAVVVRTNHHTLIYDTGPRSPGGFDAGAQIVSPFLRWWNIQHIDQIIISHGDMDHRGGLLALLKSLPVDRVITSVPDLDVGTTRKILQCKQGQHWNWDGIEFSILYPPPGQTYQDNNSCCVLKISSKGQSILIPGDIERPAELSLLQNLAAKIQANILIAPHHGSKTSSTWEWIKKVQPKIVVFSTGYLNRYHFPSPIVMERYQQLSAQLLNTAKNGAVTLTITPSGQIQISEASCCHYWQK